MAKKRESQQRVGRPPAGLLAGETVRGYRRLMVRLPETSHAQLDAASRALGLPKWHVIVNAIEAYIGAAPVIEPADRDLVRRMLKREAEG